MPTYQYSCTDCGEQVEAVQKFTDEPLKTCPACGGRLRKVFSPVGVVFKGSGFYRTDSRAAASKSKETKDGKDSGAKESAGSPDGAKVPAGAGSSGSGGSGSGSAGSSGSAAKPGAGTT